MFADFLKRLTQPEPAQLPDADARLALTALLVRIAKSDNDYAPEEKARIDQITIKRYGLDALGATALRAEAAALEQEAPDTVRFTRAIKDAVPYDARMRSDEENALLRMVSNLLGVTDTDSAIVRKRIEDNA